jgi:hypothetical protein
MAPGAALPSPQATSSAKAAIPQYAEHEPADRQPRSRWRRHTPDRARRLTLYDTPTHRLRRRADGQRITRDDAPTSECAEA